MTMAMEFGGFAGQLRRWRALRRMSQLDVAIRADTTQQPAAIRLAERHLGGGTPTDQPGRSQREITINQRRWLLSRPRCRRAARPIRRARIRRCGLSGPPSPCITPSTVTIVVVVSFMIVVPFSLVGRRSIRPDHRTELIGCGTGSALSYRALAVYAGACTPMKDSRTRWISSRGPVILTCH
jgi:hypothetical protein